MSDEMKEDEDELNWDMEEEEEEEEEEEDEDEEEEEVEEEEEEEEEEEDEEEIEPQEAEPEPEPEPGPVPTNDTDSDYSPRTSYSKKRRCGKLSSIDSPATSDVDNGGRKKRKRNEVLADDPVSYSDIVCEAHNLRNIDVDIPDDSITEINYKNFSKFVRPVAQEANPKATGPQLTSLVGSKWREFRELYGIDETPEVERLKAAVANESGGSDADTRGSGPGSPNGSLFNNGSAAESGDDDDYSNDGDGLKLKLFRSGNKTFRTGDRKTGRQSKKTARQGIVNFDDINLDEMAAPDKEEKKDEKKALPIKKKRVGPRIKNTKDKKEKKKAKAAAAAALALAGGKRGGYGKGAKGKKNDEPVPEPVHNSVCDVCGEGGDILLCDTCTLSWHLTCLDPPLDEVPEGMWSCPKCEAEMNGLLEEEEEDEFHGDYCKICKDGGELLCCDMCPGTYHMKCVKPALITVPEGEWVCAMCKVEPLPEKVERILFWKILTHNPTTEEVAAGAKDEPYKVRKFFVKYANSSYWKCHWIDELQLEKFHVSLYRFFCRKNDMNDPPMTEEGTLEEGEDVNVDETEHKRNLDQRFYQYGIKPEWLQVHRVIWHREMKRTKETQYLVKWRELGYDQATWEYVNDADNKDIQDFEREIEKYTALRQRVKKKAKAKLKGEKADKKKPIGWEFDIIPNMYSHAEQPSFITDSGGRLHEYQVEGINWIRYSWGQRENTILADEMGLGKTIQTITFLYSLVKEGRCDGPFLICAPLSTLVNWEREFEFWAPDMYVVSYTGNRDNRVVIRNYEISLEDDGIKKGVKAFKVKKDTTVKFHVLLTSYELVSIDANTLQSIEWKVMVIDEAHRLKNSQSKFFRTMSSYTIHYTLLLTGTPLQNNLEELFHLLNFLCPHKFLSRESFLAEFEDIGKEDQIKKLHEMLGPHMLRRLKSDVLKGMPTKSEFIVRVELSPMQKKYYKFILTKNFSALNTKGSAQVSLLNIVMELKKCCNHPYLFSTAALEAPRTTNNAYEVSGLTEASGKMVLLAKMMRKLRKTGNRVLVFSQMTRVLDLLEDFMEGHGWRYERLDGTITGSLRQAAIDRFNQPNSDIFAFLLSTRAGGLGINLATADTVFIYDSDWNPHNDIQAFSRAHRIGQVNKVMIYRFVTKGSVEERITQVAKKKMMLTHLVVRPGLGSKAAQAMSKRELDDILKFGTDEIFKDDDTDASGRIVYDDKAIDALLDRSKEGILEKESGMDDYLSSFKVASYTVKDKDEPDVEVLKQEADVIDSEYWEKLLRHHFEQEQEYKASTLGKGKRVRKQVNYNDGHLADTNKYRTGKFTAYDDSSDFDASELVDESEDGLSDDENKESGRAKKYKERDILPPLLAKVGNQIEVYGFNPRQRRAFLTAVMRYGLPPKDFKTAKDKWCIHNLRGKTEKAFQSYTSMFLRHLCEPGMDNKIETYSDGVPREGVNRLQVLSRIGIMSLIKRKVEEYSSVNTFLHPILQGHITIQERNLTGLLNELKNAAKPPNNNTPGVKKSPETNEKREEPSKTNEAADVQDEDALKIDIKDEKMDMDNNGSTDSEHAPVSGETEAEAGTLKGQNGKFSPLPSAASVTNSEKSENPSPNPELTNGNGVTKTEITEKPQLNGTNEEHGEMKSGDKMEIDTKTGEVGATGEKKDMPTSGADTTSEIEVGGIESGVQIPKFMFNIADGGFTELHVLWEAEEKRKLDNIWWRYHDYWLIAGAVVHGYGRWQDIQNDPRFDTINRPFARMSLDYKNKFIARRFKLLEQALIVEEQLKRATLMGVQQDNNHPAMSLQSRFAELECLAESHQHLSKESLSGNKPANAVLHKVLNQLETLLSDMKNDVTRLPTALAKVPPVTHRLNMSERAVLTRLAHGGQIPVTTPPVITPTTVAAVAATPPPGHLPPVAAPQQIICSPPGGGPAPSGPVMYSGHHAPVIAAPSPGASQPITNTIYLPVHPTILPSTGVPMESKIVNI